MIDHNNISIHLNDDEKFALICGMLAGMRLADKYAPPEQVIVTLYPIPVGGLGTIGLMANNQEYTGINTIRVPVVTHDVDIGYSGFALHLKYDSSRMAVTSIEDGDFGHLEHTNLQSGEAYTMCMLEPGEIRNEPMIMCWLNIRILNPPTRNNPITVDFVNSTGYNQNDCCLLQWVLNEEDHNYYSYFITPTKNVGFQITSDQEEKPKVPAQTEEMGAKAAPSCISLGTTCITPGTMGCLPIYTNSNLEDNFPYNQVHLVVKVPADKLHYLRLDDVLGMSNWTLSYTREYDGDGNLLITIDGLRTYSKQDSCTVGYLLFTLSDSVTDFSAIIGCLNAELINGDSHFLVPGYSGYIFYNVAREPGQDYPSFPQNIGGGGSGGYGGPSSGLGGGIQGGGRVWSSEGGVMTVWARGIGYTVYLEPGWNDVSIYLPFIFPDDVWEEIPIEIEAPGYILIPGGFIWEIKSGDKPDNYFSSPSRIDRPNVTDFYDTDLIHVQGPLEDNELEDINIEDTFNAELVSGPQTYEDDELEDISITDDYDTELHLGPQVYENEEPEEFSLEDTFETELETDPIYPTGENIDDIETEDIVDTDLNPNN